MKKPFLLLVAGTLVFTACKKSNNPGPEEEGKNEDVYELPYNKEGVTKNKAFIESEGREFVKKIDDLNTEPSIKALESLATLELPELSLVVNAIAKVGSSKEKIASINKVITQIAAASTEKESYKLSQAFGIYVYDAAKDTWKKTASTNKIEFQFPAIKGSKTNTAVLTIDYKNSGKSFTFTETEYSWNYNPNTGDWNESRTDVEKTFELPAEITAKMTIGGSSVMSLTSAYTYHGDNLPKSANVDFKFGAYGAKTEVNNDSKLVKVAFSFSKGAETLISASANSNFSSLSYDKIMSDDSEIEDLFQSANASLSLGGVTLAGELDFRTIDNILKPIRDKEPSYPYWDDYFKGIVAPNSDDYPNYDAYEKALNEYNAKWDAADSKYDADVKKYDIASSKYEKEYATTLADALNKNTKLVIANTTTNQKIASVSFQVQESKYTSGKTTYYYYDTEPIMVFGDGSKVDFETFGETGFQKLIDDLENLINKFDN